MQRRANRFALPSLDTSQRSRSPSPLHYHAADLQPTSSIVSPLHHTPLSYTPTSPTAMRSRDRDLSYRTESPVTLARRELNSQVPPSPLVRETAFASHNLPYTPSLQNDPTTPTNRIGPITPSAKSMFEGGGGDSRIGVTGVIDNRIFSWLAFFEWRFNGTIFVNPGSRYREPRTPTYQYSRHTTPTCRSKPSTPTYRREPATPTYRREPTTPTYRREPTTPGSFGWLGLKGYFG